MKGGRKGGWYGGKEGGKEVRERLLITFACEEGHVMQVIRAIKDNHITADLFSKEVITARYGLTAGGGGGVGRGDGGGDEGGGGGGGGERVGTVWGDG